MSVISDGFKFWPRSKFGQSVRIALRELALQLTDTADPAASMQIHPVSGAPDDADGRVNGSVALRSSGKMYVKRAGAYKEVITTGSGGNDFGAAGILTDKIVNSTANTGIDVGETLNSAGVGFWQTLTYDLATGSPLGFQSEFVQDTARSSGQATAIAARATSLAGDANCSYVDFLARTPVDGGGLTVVHTVLRVEPGHDRLFDLSATGNNQNIVTLPDNVAVAFQITEDVTEVLGIVTTTGSEVIRRGYKIRPNSADVDTILDPGTGTAIPVTNPGVIPLTIGAGAETNTLASPTFTGQRISIVSSFQGAGTREISTTDPINQAGDTKMTFAVAGDFIELVGVRVGGGLTWRVAANDGVTLAP